MSMITSTNFTDTSFIELKKMRLLVWSLAVISLILLLWVALVNRSYQGDIEKLESEVIELEVKYKEIEDSIHVVHEYSAMVEMGRRVDIVNDLIDIRGSSTAGLLGKFEKVLPKNVVLTNLVHRPKVGEVDVVIESKDTLSLTAFVNDLEEDKQFKQVLIARQSHPGEGDDSNAYEIKLLQ